jgi:hypothetical protein
MNNNRGQGLTMENLKVENNQQNPSAVDEPSNNNMGDSQNPTNLDLYQNGGRRRHKARKARKTHKKGKKARKTRGRK